LIQLPFPPRSSLRRDLLVSTIDAMAFSVMVGCGETYFSAFALALGLGPVAAGMVASVPVLFGALLQLASPLAVARIGSNRRWVVVCTLVQACCFIPMVWWAIRGDAELWELLAAASIYWSAGMASVPAWTAWMASLVPDQLRTPYFANRNRLSQFAVFLGFVLSGLVLQWGEARESLLTAFGGPGTKGASGTPYGVTGQKDGVGCVTKGPFAGWKDWEGRESVAVSARFWK
jgi:hypothetical protein